MNTNSTFIVMVGTVKKSVDTMWADMVVQEGPPGLVSRSTERPQEARDSTLRKSDTEHLKFAMNPGCTPQRIGRDHLCDQSADFYGGAGATSTPALRLGQPGPESPKPLALPAHNGICLDVQQGLAPVAPQTPKANPKYPVPGCQQRTLAFSLKGCELDSECCVLDGNGLMSAKEQSDESEYRQKKDWHISDSFHPPTCQSTRYERIDYWRRTGDVTER
jgi:hypothetical protein